MKVRCRSRSAKAKSSTKGLDGLRERLKEYYELGARFAKWRAVIDIGAKIPSYTCITANTHALARYAALCQEQQIVPIVEPEVLMDGDHDIDTCYEVTEWVLKQLYMDLYTRARSARRHDPQAEHGDRGREVEKQASVEEVAAKTIKCLKACTPAAVPGIAFLSGGQSDEDATAHLDAMIRMGGLPWKLTYSYGRALHQNADDDLGPATTPTVRRRRPRSRTRAKMNGMASRGEWQKKFEKAA